MVLIDLYIWADMDLYKSPDKNWFDLATYTSYDDDYWVRSYLVVDLDYKIHLMHVLEQEESQPDIYLE